MIQRKFSWLAISHPELFQISLKPHLKRLGFMFSGSLLARLLIGIERVHAEAVLFFADAVGDAVFSFGTD